MSYNRMNTFEDINSLPKQPNNGERYPPIPLPAPNAKETNTPANISNSNGTGGEAMNSALLLETGQIIILSNPGLASADSGMQDSLHAKNISFNDQTIRKGFIRKVYFILMTQLLFTCGMISIFMFHEPTKMFVQNNRSVVFAAVIINIVVLVSMACCEAARRSFPVNFVCLGLFTATMSLLLGAVASTLDVNIVLMAVGITTVLVLALSIFAIQTKYDFTAWGGVLVTVVVCLLILSFAGAFLRREFGETAVSCLGALLASFLLIYDTQMILGGTHKYQFNPEEYIFAALTLYVDVVRIFLYVLRLSRN